MFEQTLKDILDRMDGSALGAIVMDQEGISLSKVGDDPDPSMDTETLAMEYTIILKNALKTAEMVDAGKVNEFYVRNERFTTLLRMIDDTYFVAMFLKPDGNMGKGRFLLRSAASTIVDRI
jgi:predicted regulator of Ras-like GTPase activity (Roadblock/LC7/MglB family)